jgi:hypothetical protein
MDPSIFDEVFRDGAFTEERLDAAGVLLMNVARENPADAVQAKQLLAQMLLLAIADGRCAHPERCAAHYYEVMRAAFGEPTLLDCVKGNQSGF